MHRMPVSTRCSKMSRSCIACCMSQFVGKVTPPPFHSSMDCIGMDFYGWVLANLSNADANSILTFWWIPTVAEFLKALATSNLLPAAFMQLSSWFLKRTGPAKSDEKKENGETYRGYGVCAHNWQGCVFIHSIFPSILGVLSCSQADREQETRKNELQLQFLHDFFSSWHGAPWLRHLFLCVITKNTRVVGVTHNWHAVCTRM